jgi:glycosyltransferase involved in cell wall biosynthesis
MLLNQSIICFGGEDWWYHHPHSKAHLMRKFARAGNKVIFVNSISMGLPNLAHRDLLPRIKRKLGSYSKLARETDEGITVVSPPSLPFFGSAAARTFNRRVISAQLNRLARSRGLTKPILWIAIPTAAEMIGMFDEAAVVYQVSDKYDANTMDHATDPALIRAFHEQAIDAADLVFYSGRKLFNEATRGCEHSYLLEQGVDYEHWRRVADETLPVAPEVANIPRPRLGYFGAIEPWLVDQELIKRAARERPEWQWIFIGNKSRGLEIEDLPNTHFLPPVPYEQLPNYAAGFDVCVLPWETEQSFTSYGSAIKVREYLATGKPVVIAPLPEYEAMTDVLRIARSREEFLGLVEDALGETDPELRRKRQAAVADGTWDARADFVGDLIERVLATKEHS